MLGVNLPNREREAGVTVLEITIVSFILLLVISAFLGLLGSLTESEKRSQALVSNEEAVRFVLLGVAKDVRAGNPLDSLSSSAAFKNSLQVQLGPTDGTRQVVRWVYDTSDLTFRRNVMSDSTSTATIVSSDVLLRNVRNGQRTPPVPVFEYFDQNGSRYDLASPAMTPAKVAQCAIRVRITISSDSNPGPEPFQVTQDVHLRNRLPGGFGCA